MGSKDRYAQLLLVVADKGIGKRSLLQAMAQQANDQNHYVIPSNIYKTKDFKEQIHYLIATIRRKKRLNLGKGEDWFRIGIAALSIPAPGVSNIANVLYQIDEAHKKENYNGDYLTMMLLDALSKLYQKTGANERIVILLYPEKVNPLDQEGESPLELISLLEYIEARGMPPKVRFVIAQRPQDVIIEAVRKGEPANLRDMCAKFMEVGKMDPNESRQFIRLYDTGHKLDEAMEQVFLERYGGWPRLMKLALDELQKETGEITEEIMKSLPKLVDDFWERRYKEIRDNKPEAALNVVQTVSLLPHPYEYDDVELFSNLEPVAMERVAIKDAPVNRYLEIKDWPDSFTGKLRENCLHTIHATAKEYVVNLLKNSINKRIYRQRLNNIASHYEDKI
ncbi:hypothetical protein KA005_25210, partial [bacterium]|nr:hypothetical protein [bacterium]